MLTFRPFILRLHSIKKKLKPELLIYWFFSHTGMRKRVQYLRDATTNQRITQIKVRVLWIWKQRCYMNLPTPGKCLHMYLADKQVASSIRGVKLLKLCISINLYLCVAGKIIKCEHHVQ